MTESAQPSMLINGVEQESIPADDRGLLYGDGLFETIAFVDGRAPLWPLHMQRLSASCARLFLPMPEAELLAEECARLTGYLSRAVVRITLTRGCGGQAYFPPQEPQPNRILMRRSYPQGRAGVVMIRSSISPGTCAPVAGIKHLNRLEQVLIARECQQYSAAEALVCDAEGYVIEGLSSNLIVEQNDQLIAPGPHPAAVAGVGLAWLKQTLGPALTERPLHMDELRPDDPIWVINSVAGIRPVISLDGQPRSPGVLMSTAMQHWNELFY